MSARRLLTVCIALAPPGEAAMQPDAEEWVRLVNQVREESSATWSVLPPGSGAVEGRRHPLKWSEDLREAADSTCERLFARTSPTSPDPIEVLRCWIQDAGTRARLLSDRADFMHVRYAPRDGGLAVVLSLADWEPCSPGGSAEHPISLVCTVASAWSDAAKPAGVGAWSLQIPGLGPVRIQSQDTHLPHELLHPRFGRLRVEKPHWKLGPEGYRASWDPSLTMPEALIAGSIPDPQDLWLLAIDPSSPLPGGWLHAGRLPLVWSVDSECWFLLGADQVALVEGPAVPDVAAPISPKREFADARTTAERIIKDKHEPAKLSHGPGG